MWTVTKRRDLTKGGISFYESPTEERDFEKIKKTESLSRAFFTFEQQKSKLLPPCVSKIDEEGKENEEGNENLSNNSIAFLKMMKKRLLPNKELEKPIFYTPPAESDDEEENKVENNIGINFLTSAFSLVGSAFTNFIIREDEDSESVKKFNDLKKKMKEHISNLEEEERMKKYPNYRSKVGFHLPDILNKEDNSFKMISEGKKGLHKRMVTRNRRNRTFSLPPGKPFRKKEKKKKVNYKELRKKRSQEIKKKKTLVLDLEEEDELRFKKRGYHRKYIKHRGKIHSLEKQKKEDEPKLTTPTEERTSHKSKNGENQKKKKTPKSKKKKAIFAEDKELTRLLSSNNLFEETYDYSKFGKNGSLGTGSSPRRGIRRIPIRYEKFLRKESELNEDDHTDEEFDINDDLNQSLLTTMNFNNQYYKKMKNKTKAFDPPRKLFESQNRLEFVKERQLRKDKQNFNPDYQDLYIDNHSFPQEDHEKIEKQKAKFFDDQYYRRFYEFEIIKDPANKKFSDEGETNLEIAKEFCDSFLSNSKSDTNLKRDAKIAITVDELDNVVKNST